MAVPPPIDWGGWLTSMVMLFVIAGVCVNAIAVVMAYGAAKLLQTSLGDFHDTHEDDQVDRGPYVQCLYSINGAFLQESPRKCMIPLQQVQPGRFTLHGQATFWHITGEKAGEVRFHQGEPDGPTTVWHDNGQLKMQGEWDQGRKEGCWTHYSETGEEVACEEWLNGQCLQVSRATEGNREQISRYHWALAIAIDARRLHAIDENTLLKKHARRQMITVTSIVVVALIVAKTLLAIS
jgi:hypothetical protein